MDTEEKTKIEIQNTSKFDWKTKGVLESMDISINFIFSIGLAGLLSSSLFFLDQSNGCTDTRNYFYWLNFIPAGISILYGATKVDWSKIADLLGIATGDYILLKTVFRLNEEMRFYVLGCALGGAFVTVEAFKGRRRFNFVMLFLFMLQIFALSLNYEQFVILFLVVVSLVFVKYKAVSDKDAARTRLFLVGVFYAVDLLMNIRITKQAAFINLKHIRLPFYAYTLLAVFYVILSGRIEYFSNAFALANLIAISTYVIYNEAKGIQISFVDEYTAKMALVVSVGLLVLSHILSRSKITRVFPPKYQGLFDFTYFSLENFLYSATYDHMVIRIRETDALPRSKSTQLIHMRIVDFKMVCVLHILNELIRDENISEIDLNDERVFSRLSNFTDAYYGAIEKAKEHHDALDQEIEGAIQSIVDVNNDVFSKVLHFVGFKRIGLGFLFNRNSYTRERNELLAFKIEDDIRKKGVGNIAGAEMFLGDTDMN
ncbi:hypothetical protein ECANGB1_1091 [Enterospora canceri]|uniref:Uncharacterized protein n=1 Tax=Enterospora canceri TaxID=1081671 RepID=A0A1Y1S6V2_9MICR|nr:hypothetical protein ECANGB1_1091 [Enterospora canceri]